MGKKMYSPQKTSAPIYAAEEKSNAMIMIACMLITFFGGMAVMKVYSSPNAKAQIFELVETGTERVQAYLNESLSSFTLFRKQEVEGGTPGPQLEGPAEFDSPAVAPSHPTEQYAKKKCQPQYRWVVYSMPFQDKCGNWHERRIAKKIRM